MYHAHWGLTRSPYRDGADPRGFHASPVHDEALARMEFLIRERRRVGLLLGESGAGKSLLLEVFCRDLRRTGCTAAVVDLLAIGRAELLQQIAAGWNLASRPGDDDASLWRKITDRIVIGRIERQACVLLLDNADEAQADVISDVVRLAQTDAAFDPPFSIILAAQPDRVRMLTPRLLDLAALRIDLFAWDEADTIGYLTAALKQAGRDEPAFDEQAMVRLHELAAGIPRRVSQLADLALLAGAGRCLDVIDAETVESVVNELGTVRV